jgi:NTE family protein
MPAKTISDHAITVSRMGRAVVLGGGGPVGIAWETAVVGSLISAGVDLAAADLVVGTSAGSVVGVQLKLGLDLAASAARHAEPVPLPEPVAPGDPGDALANPVVALFAKEMSHDDRLVAIGEFAIAADTTSEDEYLKRFAALQLPWPPGFVCTGVDAESGEFVGWTATSGADLALAVGASCAVPRSSPPITINGRRYMDGGMRSLTNADLAANLDCVVVITILGTGLRDDDDPRTRFRRLATQREIDGLREAGATVEVIAPDAATADAVGARYMDPSIAPAAGHAGYRQGLAERERVAAIW